MTISFGFNLFRSSELEVARRAEALGYDSIWTGGHILWHRPTNDPLLTLAAWSSVTERVLLGTSILLLPLYHPVVTAKQVGTLDRYANGRLILGVGVGGENAAEFDACGVSVRGRGKRCETAIEVMRALWRDEPVTCDGENFRLVEASMEPKPARPGGPPIWIAGRAPRVLQRAGRIGDGWLGYFFSPRRFTESVATIREAAEKAGRDPAQVTITHFIFVFVDDNWEYARRNAVEHLSQSFNRPFDGMVDKFCAVGTPEQCAEKIEEFTAAGATHFVLAPTDPAERFSEQMERWAREIVPRVRRTRAKLPT